MLIDNCSHESDVTSLKTKVIYQLCVQKLVTLAILFTTDHHDVQPCHNCCGRCGDSLCVRPCPCGSKRPCDARSFKNLLPDDRALCSVALSCQFCDMGATAEHDIGGDVNRQVLTDHPHLFLKKRKEKGLAGNLCRLIGVACGSFGVPCAWIHSHYLPHSDHFQPFSSFCVRSSASSAAAACFLHCAISTCALPFLAVNSLFISV